MSCYNLDARTLMNGAARLGVCLSAEQARLFRRYYMSMVEWNARVNLTTVTEWEQAQRRHFLDSLSVRGALTARVFDGIWERGRFVDVGSGAGLPGIPLKIAFPGMTGALVEATERKARFLREMVSALSLDGLEVARGRAEDLARLPEMRERFDVALARAVAPMPALAELTLPFCRVGGRVIVHKTLDAAEEIESARRAIEELGGEIRGSIGPLSEHSGGHPGESGPAGPNGSESRRTLLVIEKVAPTPTRYPRRAGIPAKRPLMDPDRGPRRGSGQAGRAGREVG